MTIRSIPRRCGGFRRGKGADAGIDADDEPDAAIGGLLNDLIPHAVAFADAVRHVVVHFAAAEFKRGFQDDDRGGAVHVVVAVDEHRFAALDGRLQPLHGSAKSQSSSRDNEDPAERREKLVRWFSGRNPAYGQQPGQRDG